MKIDVQRQDGNIVARIEGSVDGNNAADFQMRLQDAMKDDDKSMVLDFSQLSYISSSGLRVLLLLAKELKNKEVGFAICSLQGQVSELFMASGFDKIIAVHDTLENALASLTQ